MEFLASLYGFIHMLSFASKGNNFVCLKGNNNINLIMFYMFN